MNIRIVPHPQKHPNALDISMHAMKDGKWEATVYGYEKPLYIYGATLMTTILNVAAVIDAKQGPE